MEHAFLRGVTTCHILDLPERRSCGLTGRSGVEDGQGPCSNTWKVLGRPESMPSATSDKVRHDPVKTVAQLSREASISQSTGSHVKDNLNLRSRDHQGRAEADGKRQVPVSSTGPAASAKIA